MRINNNIMALNAHRQLGANQAQGAKSMEKLSSGLRINRAGDDAAGLAISEKMRGQIRGLKQATRNAQDGISLIQTAEGALNETHSILQRMRELANQAANDTNVEVDRNEIQKEINALTSEINRIGNTTEFNTMKLLNGERSNTREVTGMNFVGGTDTTSNAGGTGFDVKLLDGANALEAGSHELEITVDRNTRALQTENTAWSDFDATSTGASAGVVFEGHQIAASTATIATEWTLTWSDVDEAFTLTNTEAATGNDGAVTDLVYVGQEYDNHGLKFTITDQGTIANNETLVFETTTSAETIGTQQVGWTTQGGTSNPTDVVVTITDAQEAALAGGGTITAEWVAANQINVVLTDSEGNVLSDDVIDGATAYENHGIHINFNEAATEDMMGAKFEFDIAADTYTVNASLNGGSAVEIMSDYDGTSATADFSGIAGVELSADGAVTAGTFEFKVEQTVEGIEDNSLNFQIGANQAQSMNLSIGDMRAEALGLSSSVSGGDFTASRAVTDGTDATAQEFGLDVSSHTSAARAITVINEAIEKVSAERSMLGASQNRLEHTIANLGTSAENLQAAELRIRDLDMAEEIMAFTKNNILQQAATAMLAQANMAPQSVLQLLG